MKLRNKKTGEIIDVYKGQILLHCNQGKETITFKSIEELKEWEDYEEPKDFWYIEDFGIMCGTESEFTDRELACFTKKDIEKLKEIGNHFETKEEAEKAVEKLKAWKRLKEQKEVKFEGWKRNEMFCGDYTIQMTDQSTCDDKDLDLLFGGKDE